MQTYAYKPKNSHMLMSLKRHCVVHVLQQQQKKRTKEKEKEKEEEEKEKRKLRK